MWSSKTREVPHGHPLRQPQASWLRLALRREAAQAGGGPGRCVLSWGGRGKDDRGHQQGGGAWSRGPSGMEVAQQDKEGGRTPVSGTLPHRVLPQACSVGTAGLIMPEGKRSRRGGTGRPKSLREEGPG